MLGNLLNNKKEPIRKVPPAADILVCQAGTCRRNGSEAVLLEIEELVNAIDKPNCKVKASGCLGLCSLAPSAIISRRRSTFINTKGRDEEVFTRLNSLEKSALVVEAATGQNPDTSNPGLQLKLKPVRLLRATEEAMTIYRWNQALKSINDQLNHYSKPDTVSMAKLNNKFQSILAKVGYQVLPSRNKIPSMPKEIDNYSLWSLSNVSIVSRCTAIFHFVSNDRKRGTPHPRGRGRPPPNPITWHTTMLAEVGWNEEGPLPWIERDYTPITSSKDWEAGICDLLIKIYDDGIATSWLYNIAINSSIPSLSLNSTSSSITSSNVTSPIALSSLPRVWLSQPIKTLNVPGLTSSSRSVNMYPSSVLLLLAGTGVVALPQILCHRDPLNKLGMATHPRNQLNVPIDLVLSCRKNDILMIPEIIQFCQESQEVSTEKTSSNKGLRHFTLLLTGESDASTEKNSFFGKPTGVLDERIIALETLPNTEIQYSRLTKELLDKSLTRMPQPCRYIVSGPNAFNSSVREMLTMNNISNELITVLEA